MPFFGIKADAIPGRICESPVYFLDTGCFSGQCSELCGVNHAFMPIHVEVLSYSDGESSASESSSEVVSVGVVAEGLRPRILTSLKHFFHRFKEWIFPAAHAHAFPPVEYGVAIPFGPGFLGGPRPDIPVNVANASHPTLSAFAIRMMNMWM